MRIDNVNLSNDGLRYEATFRTASGDFPVWYSSRQVPMKASAESLITLGLLPAMLEGGEFILPEAEVSAVFLEGVAAIQEQFSAWYDNLSKVTISGVCPVKLDPSGDRTAASFSGGVDSHYTLLECGDQIDDLYYLHGFDSGIVDPSLRQTISDMLVIFGDLYGARVIEFDTNARELWYPLGLRHMGGAPVILSGVHLLPEEIRTFLLPSSREPGIEVRGAWHSESLPHWSADARVIVEHGRIHRLGKVRELCKSDLILEHLHVCWGDYGTGYNCGICDKCMRTLIQLEICHSLDRCPTLKGKLDLKRIANLHFGDSCQRKSASYNLAAIADDPEFADLAAALRKAVNRPEWVLRLSELYWAIKKKLGLVG